LKPGGSGVRAQALDLNGNFVDDFHFVYAEGIVHVSDVPSPAATASLTIARHIVDMVVQRADGNVNMLIGERRSSTLPFLTARSGGPNSMVKKNIIPG
jgi:L-2-hydroxyglutarate oxidase LhgO